MAVAGRFPSIRLDFRGENLRPCQLQSGRKPRSAGNCGLIGLGGPRLALDRIGPIGDGNATLGQPSEFGQPIARPCSEIAVRRAARDPHLIDDGPARKRRRGSSRKSGAHFDRGCNAHHGCGRPITGHSQGGRPQLRGCDVGLRQDCASRQLMGGRDRSFECLRGLRCSGNRIGGVDQRKRPAIELCGFGQSSRGNRFESVRRANRVGHLVDDSRSGCPAACGGQEASPHARGWHRTAQRELVPGADRTECERLGRLNLVKPLNNKANPVVPENRQRRPVALTGLEFRSLDEDVTSLRRHTYVAGNRR